jgi:diguanylate cyclase (GGDEF)-like protein
MIRIVPRELLAPIVYGLVAIVLLLNVYLIAKKRLVANLQKHLINLELQLSQTRESVLYDPLTQLYSRRVCDEILPKELSRAARLKRPVSILLVEVDNFREANVNYGHMFGDCLLREVAGLLKNTARASDLVFRFGGDDFLLLLPDTDAAGVQALRRRLDRAGRGLVLSPPSGGRMAVTFSSGGATFRMGQAAAELLGEAEAALYEEQTQAHPTVRPSR